MIDAKEVSAAHRARYFWGNLPGMNRLVEDLYINNGGFIHNIYTSLCCRDETLRPFHSWSL